jgi:hypothetical protein
MASLTVSQLEPEDHFWHVLRRIESLAAVLQAHRYDPTQPLSEDDAADAHYVVQVVADALKADRASAFLLRNSRVCRAKDGEHPLNPPDQT